jgi:hypothetical protein
VWATNEFPHWRIRELGGRRGCRRKLDEVLSQWSVGFIDWLDNSSESTTDWQASLEFIVTRVAEPGSAGQAGRERVRLGDTML